MTLKEILISIVSDLSKLLVAVPALEAAAQMKPNADVRTIVELTESESRAHVAELLRAIASLPENL